MKAGSAFFRSGIVAACIVLASCGGSQNTGSASSPPPPPPPPPPVTMELDTAAVLAIVQTKTSETAEPFQVDNGAVAVIPVGDETSSPISVDAE
jgi:hypothetical protein